MFSNRITSQIHKDDFLAGLVVFLVALPLCLGIALAANAPLISGLLAGIIGGLVVGALSGSHTSVSGPAAGLTAIIALQISGLGSFNAFLVALIIAGIIQVIMGIIRAGFITSFFPTTVVNGLLFSIGIILIFKQLPHLFGVDSSFDGDMSFWQNDNENTFSELINIFSYFHVEAMTLGLMSLGLLLAWQKIEFIKKLSIPAPLAVVVLSTLASLLINKFGGSWSLPEAHRVQVPVFTDIASLSQFFAWPDFSILQDHRVYIAGLTLALVASLETLLNLEAVDKLDKFQRTSPPNRELLAQGIGNIFLGFIGGLPLTSVIVRSSVNINANAKSKNSAIIHGTLLLASVFLMPSVLNMIPLSALAAILIFAGAKLASPVIVREAWRNGYNQFIPFALTVVAILFTDLLVGVIIGLIAGMFFILHNNFNLPIKTEIEQRFDGETLRIILAEHVSFLNRGGIKKYLDNLKSKSRVIIDAGNTRYIDCDVLGLIRDFKELKAEKKEISLSLIGFKPKYDIKNQTNFLEHATLELQQGLEPAQIVQALQDGNERVREGRLLDRNLFRQIKATAAGQYPLAVILSCIDSRTPAELVFDLGIGDIFNVRMAGNIVSKNVIGSIEFACAVAGAKVIIVMGHTKCGAVSAAINLFKLGQSTEEAYGCHHLGSITDNIQKAFKNYAACDIPHAENQAYEQFENDIIKLNVYQSLQSIASGSIVLSKLLADNNIEMHGCIYDVESGSVNFLPCEFSLDLVKNKKDIVYRSEAYEVGN